MLGQLIVFSFTHHPNIVFSLSDVLWTSDSGKLEGIFKSGIVPLC